MLPPRFLPGESKAMVLCVVCDRPVLPSCQGSRFCWVCSNGTKRAHAIDLPHAVPAAREMSCPPDMLLDTVAGDAACAPQESCQPANLGRRKRSA